MQLKKHIPSAITCLNLFSGCMAAVAALEFNFVLAAGLVFLAAFFDFCDGLAARQLKAYSAIGKELDSLADMVSFGFVPSVVVFSLLRQQMALQELSAFVPYVAFLIAIFSALRLAIFNIDERQTTTFIGMPTPANALFWVSLAAYNTIHPMSILTPGLLVVLVVVFSLLLVAEIPMFSLKIKNLSFKKNIAQFSIVIAAIVFLLCFKLLGISLTILLYILMSVLLNIIKR